MSRGDGFETTKMTVSLHSQARVDAISYVITDPTPSPSPRFCCTGCVRDDTGLCLSECPSSILSSQNVKGTEYGLMSVATLKITENAFERFKAPVLCIDDTPQDNEGGL